MQVKNKVLIVEDNAINRLSLETLLKANNYIVEGSFTSAEQAYNFLKSSKIHIALIDINLSGNYSGIWLANKIREDFNIPFIFITAHGDDETIAKVKHTQPDGYLMKPYNETTLVTNIAIALTNFKQNQNTDETIFIKDNYIRVKLSVSDILYIQSEGNYLQIVLKSKKHLIRETLPEFLKKLPKDIFIRTHRRYVINKTKVNYMGSNYITITTTNIPISKTYKSEVIKFLDH